MTEKKQRKPAIEAVAASHDAGKAKSPLSFSKAEFRLLQRWAKKQTTADAQEFAASIGAFASANSAANNAAKLLSEMLHSDDHGLNSIQKQLDSQPLGALALVRLIRMERERGAGKIEREAHQRMSSEGGKQRALKMGFAEKDEQMRALWASGKYSNRDLCAEQEYDALGISFSKARKALRNTPEPDR